MKNTKGKIMEIPTKEIIEKLRLLTMERRVVSHAVAVAIAEAGISVIEAQALEIRELQAVVVRVRNEATAKSRMAAWKALPEPRPVWEKFKKTWQNGLTSSS